MVFATDSMGRKAKNKQPAPAPFVESSRAYSKGKRKADDRDGQFKKAKVSAVNGKAAVRKITKLEGNASTSKSNAKRKAPSVLVNGDAKKLQEAEME